MGLPTSAKIRRNGEIEPRGAWCHSEYRRGSSIAIHEFGELELNVVVGIVGDKYTPDCVGVVPEITLSRPLVSLSLDLSRPDRKH